MFLADLLDHLMTFLLVGPLLHNLVNLVALLDQPRGALLLGNIRLRVVALLRHPRQALLVDLRPVLELLDLLALCVEHRLALFSRHGLVAGHAATGNGLFPASRQLPVRPTALPHRRLVVSWLRYDQPLEITTEMVK